MPLPLIGGYVAGWTLKKVLPYLIIGALLIALVGLWKWDRNTINGLKAERDGAVLQLDTLTADRDRYMAATKVYTDTIAMMSEEAEKKRADLAMAESILKQSDELAKIEAEELSAQIAKWKARANANPQDTRPVGPIATSAYCDVMHSIGQSPAGCPAADHR